jgi:hypothetical protein
MADVQLLKDETITPSVETLKSVMGRNYKVYSNLVQKVTSDIYVFDVNWKYYKDGKAWLCKVTKKGKTVFWLSVWQSHIKISFYFTEKDNNGISELKIEKEIIENFLNEKAIGKLKPLTIDVYDVTILQDVYTIIDYKIKRQL